MNVSVQVLIKFPKHKSRKFIVINETYQNKLDLNLIKNWSKSNDCIVEFLPITQNTNVIHLLLEKYFLQDLTTENIEKFKISGTVHMFYSFQDLGFAFGWNNVIKQLKESIDKKPRGRIEQRRSITGTLKIRSEDFITSADWKIHDLCGWTNSSLKDLASGLGIDMTNKDSLDDLKSSMDLALITRTEIFLNYALDDVVVLKQIKESFVNMVNEVLKKTLDLPWYLTFTGKNIPKTMGRLVAESFERFLIHSTSTDSTTVLTY